MGCLGYFSTRKETRMPRLEDGVDELGIRYRGDVLSGKTSVEEAFSRGKLGVQKQIAQHEAEEQRRQVVLAGGPGAQEPTPPVRPYVPENMLGRNEARGVEAKSPSLEQQVLRRGGVSRRERSGR